MTAKQRRGLREPAAREPTSGGGAARSTGADPEAVAREIVLRQLTMGPRSRAQLATKLAQRDTPDAVAQRVLDRLEQVGLVDDAAFAAGWVHSRHAARGLSRRALQYELRTKGIDDHLAEAALETLDGDDERRAAEQLVARRLRTVQGLPRQKQVTRLVAMLARKGYGGGLALQVVRDALDTADRPSLPG